MPRYRFKCHSCLYEREKMCDPGTEEVPCHYCEGLVMLRMLPSSGTQKVTEVIDQFVGVKRDVDQREALKERRDDYFWEVQVPRLVQEYSVETCIQEGWLVYNDKGELVINKPPSKR